MKEQQTEEIKKEIKNGIVHILNDRKGLHLNDLDDDLAEEIENAFLKVISEKIDSLHSTWVKEQREKIEAKKYTDAEFVDSKHDEDFYYKDGYNRAIQDVIDLYEIQGTFK
jgi:hypothetical protein